MNGDNSVVKSSIRVTPVIPANAYNDNINTIHKKQLFITKGYHLITFDINDVAETTRITGLLRTFFLPHVI